MKRLTAIFLVFTFLTFFVVADGSDTKTNNPGEKEKNILLQKDREIAKASGEKGILAAFYPYMIRHSILLPQRGHPVYGKNSYQKLMKHKKIQGKKGKPQWEPIFADVSSAGDLGYTHGRFQLPGTDPGSNKKMNYSYYGTIWQKDSLGQWKVVFSQGLLLLKGLNQKPMDKKIDWTKLDKKTKEVVNTELEFAKYSIEKGAPAAFYHFIADTGIVLGVSGPPRTKETYAKILAAQQEKKIDTGKSTLEWEPIFSHVSASGDMAYNYGPYKFTATDANGKQQESYGYFVTVWKKQPDKSWKFVLDGGNISPPRN